MRWRPNAIELPAPAGIGVKPLVTIALSVAWWGMFGTDSTADALRWDAHPVAALRTELASGQAGRPTAARARVLPVGQPSTTAGTLVPAAPVPVLPAVTTSTSTPPTRPAAPAVPASSGSRRATSCGEAVAFLQQHAAPGFTLICPGDANGRQALTCVGNDTGAGPCRPYQDMIIISDLNCPAPYENEASNS
jgi:hypothetical protein